MDFHLLHQLWCFLFASQIKSLKKWTMFTNMYYLWKSFGVLNFILPDCHNMHSHMHSHRVYGIIYFTYVCINILEDQIHRQTKELICFQIILSYLTCPKLSKIVNVKWLDESSKIHSGRGFKCNKLFHHQHHRVLKLGFQNEKKDTHTPPLALNPEPRWKKTEKKECWMITVWAPGLIHVKYWLNSLKSWPDGILDKRIKS